MRRSPETVTLLCHGPSMLTHVTLLYKAHVASELEACEALRRFDPPLHVHVCSVSNCLACLCTLPTPCRARNWRHRACTHHSVKMITLCVRPRTHNVGMSEEVKESASRLFRMCVCVCFVVCVHVSPRCMRLHANRWHHLSRRVQTRGDRRVERSRPVRGVGVAPEHRQLPVFLFLFPARFNLLLHLALAPTQRHVTQNK
jgi:hypothetical protein